MGRDQYVRYKSRVIRRLAALTAAVVIAVGSAGNAWALEGTGETQKQAGLAAADEGQPTTQAADASVPADKENADKKNTDKENTDKENADKESNSSAADNFSVTGYEIYGPGESKDTLDVIRKGRQARAVVYVRNHEIRTKDVTAGSLRITKTHDSFRSSGNPKIRITSEKEETLEFTVTFTKLTYQGKGDELKFKVNNKKDDSAAQLMTVNISECEEYQNGGGDGGYAAGNPVLKVRRNSPQSPVGPGEKFTLALTIENTSDDADIEDLSVSVNSGSSFFITDDTNARIIKRLDTKKTEEVRLDMTAARELAGPSQVLDLELKYNYYSNGQLTPAVSSQKVIIPVAGGAAQGQPVIRVSRGELGGPIQAGQAFDMVIRLENTSADREIRNLSVTLEPSDQIALMDQTDTRMAGTVAAGQTVEIPVKLKAGAELASLAAELDRMRIAIRQRMEREEEARQANRELVTAMSHDLRTPLTSLLGYVDILLMGKSRDEEQEERCLEAVRQKAYQIKELSDKLFEYFIVYGKETEKLEMEEVNGAEFVGQIVEESLFDLESEGFEIRRTFDEINCHLTVDIGLARRVFGNVFSNLLKYGDKTSPIGVVYEQGAKELVIRFFNRTDRRQTAGESSGIGLKTCRKIMEDHGGTFFSRLEGDEFVTEIRFPINAAAVDAENVENDLLF